MQDFEDALTDIKALLPNKCISQEREDLISHGSSSWTYHNPKVLPGAVLYPRHTEDVSSLIIGYLPNAHNLTTLRLST